VLSESAVHSIVGRFRDRRGDIATADSIAELNDLEEHGTARPIARA
jgi:hypothetical protein